MTKTQFMTNVTRNIHRFGLKIKKHSPEILAVAGTIGTVASAVMACKATLKVNEVVEETKTSLDTIHRSAETGLTPAGQPYSLDDCKKDTTLVYVQTGAKFVKLYGPSVALGALSLGCLLTSNHILRKRNAAIAAAYAVVDRSFKEYRNRVVERFGKDIDRELRYNIKATEVEYTVTNEDGAETTVKETVDVFDPNELSEFAVMWDDGNAGWTKDPELNKCFLMQQQNYANDLLKTRGHVFLNEVYDMLGVHRTKAGQEVGWVLGNGDGYIDFRLFHSHNKYFVNHEERSVIIDPNVDGYILDLI